MLGEPKGDCDAWLRVEPLKGDYDKDDRITKKKDLTLSKKGACPRWFSKKKDAIKETKMKGCHKWN